MRRRRGGWSGSTSFYREECQSGHGTNLSTCGDDCNLVEVEYEVHGHVSEFVPAKISGPPEHCHPAEGGEVEIEQITLGGKEVPESAFSSKELEQMEESLAEAAGDDDGYDDYDDYDLDDDRSPDSFDPPDRDVY